MVIEMLQHDIRTVASSGKESVSRIQSAFRTGRWHLDFGHYNARTIVLSALAACAFVHASPDLAHADPDDCMLGGTTITCQGNQSAGIADGTDFDVPPVTVIDINSLNQNITPTINVDGLVVTNPVPVTINIDTGSFGIMTQGTGKGIFVDATAANSAVNLNIMSGSITSNDGDAVDVTTSGFNASPVTITNFADHVSNGGVAFDVRTYGDGSFIIINNTGTLSAERDTIDVLASGNNSPVTLHNTAPVTSTDQDAIDLDTRGDNSPIVAVNSGPLVADGIAVDLRTQGVNSPITFTNSASASSATDDVFEFRTDGDNSAMSVVSVGDLTASGTIFTRKHGFELSTVGNNSAITLDHTGNITVGADGGSGIEGDTRGMNSPITIVSRGAITLPGTTASGEIAAGIRATTQNGSISIDHYGPITMTGLDAVGILVETNPNEMASVNHASGTVQGGPGTGDGVRFLDAAGASFTLNLMSDSIVTTLGDDAIQGGTGNETVNNAGTVTGTVKLGTGTNAFNNNSGSLFNAGPTVNLGAGNLLNNSGIFSPGGSSTVQTTALTGNFVQNADGIMLVNVDPTAGTADRIDVTGTGNLAGSVQPLVLNPVLGPQSHTIFSAAGGTTNAGLGLGGVMFSPALQASLTFPNANDVVLSYSIDFLTGGLNPNQTALANNLNTAVGLGTGGLQPVVDALLNDVFTTSDYQNALNQLLPESYLNSETAALFAAEDFIDNLFSCRQTGQNHSAQSEGSCRWARLQGRSLDRDSDSTTIGFDEITGGFLAGAQGELASDWFAGFALGYERGSLETATGVDSDSNRYNAGLSVKYQNGPMLLAAAISGGLSNFDTTRPISIGGLNVVANSSYNVTYFSGQARAAYLFELGSWFAKPLVDATVTHLRRDGITETGAGAANLVIGGGNESFFSVTPAVEFGGDIQANENMVLRPYVRAGVSWYSDSDHSLTARFASAPAGTGAFTTTSDFGDVFVDVAAGATAFFNGGATLAASYNGLISTHIQQHEFGVKGSMPF